MTDTAAPTTSHSSRRVRDMVAAALIAALMAVTGWVSLPLGAVPVTLQTFAVALAALLLPPAWAAGSMAIYVAIGAAGVPVFASGHAGLGVALVQVFGVLRIAQHVGSPEAPVAVLASSGCRYFLRQILDPTIRNLFFISHNEVPSEARVISLGVIR